MGARSVPRKMSEKIIEKAVSEMGQPFYFYGMISKAKLLYKNKEI